MQDQIDGEKFIHQNPTVSLKREVDKCKLENGCCRNNRQGHSEYNSAI